VEPSARKTVAVIGSGCSGIAAVWALKGTEHEVYLYEADDRLGGHSNTVQWKAGKYSVGVDTGFIVLNTATYRKRKVSSIARSELHGCIPSNDIVELRLTLHHS
jgi:predicted NAD/FAD-binding protein